MFEDFKDVTLRILRRIECASEFAREIIREEKERRRQQRKESLMEKTDFIQGKSGFGAQAHRT